MKDALKIEAEIKRINKELGDYRFYGSIPGDQVRIAELTARRDALIWAMGL